MLRTRALLSLLLNASLVLAPLSTVHAHLDDHDQAHVHAGHVHDLDLDSDHDQPVADHVIELRAVVANAAAVAPSSTDWVPVLAILAVVFLTAPALIAIVRPHRRDTEPIPRRAHRQPPLRGPPLLSIQ